MDGGKTFHQWLFRITASVNAPTSYRVSRKFITDTTCIVYNGHHIYYITDTTFSVSLVVRKTFVVFLVLALPFRNVLLCFSNATDVNRTQKISRCNIKTFAMKQRRIFSFIVGCVLIK